MENKEEYFNVDVMQDKYEQNMNEKDEKLIKLVVNNIKTCLEYDGFVQLSLKPFTVHTSDGNKIYSLNDYTEREILSEMKKKFDYCKVGDFLMFEFKKKMQC